MSQDNGYDPECGLAIRFRAHSVDRNTVSVCVSPVWYLLPKVLSTAGVYKSKRPTHVLKDKGRYHSLSEIQLSLRT